MRRKLWLVLACSLLMSAPIYSEVISNLEKGIAAYEKKEYETSYQYLLPLAKKGNPKAQHHLHVMLFEGWGFPKDEKRSFYWVKKSRFTRLWAEPKESRHGVLTRDRC